ncbi:hypothetical protein K501DRAFT_283952 [Backusella circina FSU 941]|nr:hypothetical protein K501DRAFT_283952 [Backusella circina FSU 941]
MLSGQEIAWIVYAILFIGITLVLAFRCKSNLLLLPFGLFGVILSAGLIYQLSDRSSVPETEDASTFLYWTGRSFVHDLLPIISILIFFGIMEAQLVFIKHMAVAIYNRDRWGSIYLRDPEKSQGFTRTSFASNQKKRSLRPWYYWASLTVTLFYFLMIVCLVIIQIVSSSAFNKDQAIAICTTVLFVLSWLNIAIIWNSSNGASTNHIRMLRRNRDDLLFLRLAPILFNIAMAGIMVMNWVYYHSGNANITLSIAGWISMESILVYLPLFLFLIMCVHVRNIQTMGRQYPVETPQTFRRQKREWKQTHSYQTVTDMESVAKKLSEDEVSKIATPPAASYQP